MAKHRKRPITSMPASSAAPVIAADVAAAELELGRGDRADLANQPPSSTMRAPASPPT